MRKLALTIASIAILASCHSTQQTGSSEFNSNEHTSTMLRLTDSVTIHIDMHIDSPKIEIEYLDSPRRRIRFSATKIEQSTQNITTKEFATDSCTRTYEHTSDVSHKYTEPITNTPFNYILFLTATIAGAILLLRAINRH